MTPEHVYSLAIGMEADGCVHVLTLALALQSLSPYFGADLVSEVNNGGMSWDEVILALYLAAIAAPDICGTAS